MPVERATFLALCVLDEAADLITDNQPVSMLGLRCALAHLYAVGDRRKEWFDREPYDDFWRAAVEAKVIEPGCSASCGRSQDLLASMNAIARAAGMERDVILMGKISRAHGLI